ncbi:NAD-dependent epimerase/dehydratase family protein [Amycolatopsis sp. RTGN1]|uniref:NAD-dependent epimerase/dehydratase family protein n=1 Tax=Amycolatopsis ponsaeliensis TaxID=2992142 RepID=UPI002550821A|nr:NAD-dependent epimerase/dehydratase family protein [Amycolatopsis sp. RTGN1]
MQVIGGGFLATHVRAHFGDRHPGVTAIAAGVSSTIVDSAAEFDREAELLYRVALECRDRGRLALFFSTASPVLYGTPSPGTETGPVFPTSAYGRHKLALETVLAASGAGWLTLRLSNLVGSGQREHQLLPALIAQVRSGSVLVRRGVSRDLVDVRHVLAALDGLLRAGVRDTVVNVASGVPVPVERIIAGIETRLGTTAVKRVVHGPASTPVVSLDRLRRLVPEVGTFGFGPGYLSTLLDRYVPAGEPALPR